MKAQQKEGIWSVWMWEESTKLLSILPSNALPPRLCLNINGQIQCPLKPMGIFPWISVGFELDPKIAFFKLWLWQPPHYLLIRGSKRQSWALRWLRPQTSTETHKQGKRTAKNVCLVLGWAKPQQNVKLHYTAKYILSIENTIFFFWMILCHRRRPFLEKGIFGH